MAGEVGMGLNLNLAALNKELQAADKRLEVFAESAEKQMKRVSDAFALSATKGLSQLQNELTNTYSKLSKLSVKNKLSFTPTIDNASTKRIIDEVNKIVNYTRTEWEKLNAIKIGKLIDPKMINDIEALANRLSTLQAALATGRLQEGNIDIKVTDAMRVKYADEIKAIEERLKVLRMSTSEFNKLKTQEVERVIHNAQIEEDLAKKKEKQLKEEIEALKRAEAEKARIESNARKQMYSRVQSTGMYYDKNGKAKDASKQAIAAYNRLYSDKGIMSIQKMNEALSKMRAAQEKINLRTDEGQKKYKELGEKIKQVEKDLNKATGASDKLNQKQNQLSDISKKLTNRFAALFSVQAITGYVKKIIEVRGEFEMQHRAMQTLIGDIDEANKLWDKTVSLAVKSPFRVRELVTYTKQLSAYRIETEQLYDKTKMLADISAGLGVDMNRLILAYGQVKAANYLRGTELRQFSEAGINVLKELSDYFTELEGRAVSVGDVFERVSKRMVTFADVDAVLQKVTSEGNTFYKMQEKQSETLKGLMMNLTDSVDIMMNDIGKRNDSVLKKTVGLLKDIIDNWRMLEPTVVAAGTALLTYFPLKKLGQIAAAVKSIFTVGVKHPYALAIAGIASLTAGIIKAINAQSKLNAEMSEVDANVKDQLVEKLGLYKELTGVITDATASTEEYEKAEQKLKQVFGDILPDHKLEAEYIKNLSGDYQEAEEAMLSYYNAKAVEQKKDKVRQKYAEDIDTNTTDLIIDIEQAINRSRVVSEQEKVMLLSGVGGAVQETVAAIEQGKIKPENITEAIYKRLEEYSNVDFTKVVASGSSLFNAVQMGSNMRTLEQLLRNRNQAIESVKGLPFETYEQEVLAKKIEEEKALLDNASQGYKKAVNIYVEALKDLNKSEANTTEIWERANNKIKDTLQTITDSEYKEKLVSVFTTLGENAKKGSFEFNAALQTIESDLLSGTDGLSKILLSRFNAEEFSTTAAQDLFKNLEEELNEKGKKLKLTPFQEAVIEGARGIAEKFNTDVDLFSQFIPKSEDALSTVSNNLEGYIKDWEDRINKFKSSQEVEGFGVLSPDILSERIEEIDKMEAALPALREFAKLLGVIFKEDKKKKSDNLTDEQIRVIDNMNKKYRELNKTLSEGESIEGAFAAYKDAFEKAYSGTKFLQGKNIQQMTAEQFAEEVLNFPDRNDIVRFLDELAELPKELDDKVRIELAKGGHVEEMNVEKMQKEQDKMLKQIEDSFDNYEISLELDKLNIPPDLAKQLFGVDAISLDDIRSEIEAQLTESRADGGKLDHVKDLEDRLKKVAELEDKEFKDRMKKLVQHFTSTLDQIEMVRQRGGKDILFTDEAFQQGLINAEQYKQSLTSIVDNTNKEVSKINLEEFKKSSDYIAAMGDMSAYTSKELKELLKRLQDVVSSNAQNMEADELKAYTDAIDKATKNLENVKLPWEKNFISEIQEELRLQKELSDERERQYQLEQQLVGLKNSEDFLTEKLQNEINLGVDSTQTEKQLKSTIEQFAKVQNQLNASTAKISNISEQMEGVGEGAAGALTIVDMIIKGVYQSLEATKKIFDDVKALADSYGADTENESWSKWSSAMETMGNVNSEVMQGWENLKSGNIMGAIANTIGSITKLIQGINEFKDIDNEKEIERQQKRVESLEKAYGKLEKAMEEAYNTDLIKANQAAMEQNINAQIKALEAAKAAEEGKKKTDEDAVQQYADDIEELQEQKAELEKEMVETMGGTYDYASVAEQFLDAWLSAFEETGDGLSGLDKAFDDFWKDILKKQVVYGGASTILEGFIDEINNRLKDGVLDDTDVSIIDGLEEDTKAKLKEFFEYMNSKYNLSEVGEPELSGLSKGIQGITETQADILAAYWNAVRFDVSAIRQRFDEFMAMQGYGEEVNPIENHLKTISLNTTAMLSLLQDARIDSESSAIRVKVLNM